MEEEEAGVVLPQYVPLLRLDHGGELHQVADEEHLHTAEGQWASTDATQEEVDEVERVGTEHTHLVDDQQLEGSEEADLTLLQVDVSAEVPWRDQQLVGRRRELGHGVGDEGADREL